VLASSASTFAEAEEVDAILICEAGDADHLLSLLTSESAVCLLEVATEDEYQGPTICVLCVHNKFIYYSIEGYIHIMKAFYIINIELCV